VFVSLCHFCLELSLLIINYSALFIAFRVKMCSVLHARRINVIKSSDILFLKNGTHSQGAANVGTLVIASEVPLQKIHAACPELNCGPLIKSTYIGYTFEYVMNQVSQETGSVLTF